MNFAEYSSKRRFIYLLFRMTQLIKRSNTQRSCKKKINCQWTTEYMKTQWQNNWSM